ncbi:MAG: hypothetical protein KDI37_15145 [Xanthomonadales bacterium]|nr:hypothetical protein [Xanthomonadales bacterium]MCB1643063.1 hypothetical protein [Xanthomonadales bacterium]
MPASIDLATLLVPDLTAALNALGQIGLACGSIQRLPRDLALALGQTALIESPCASAGHSLRLIQASMHGPGPWGWLDLTAPAISSTAPGGLPLSLRRGSVDHIDLVQLHSKSPRRSAGFYEGLGLRLLDECDGESNAATLALPGGQRLRITPPSATPSVSPAICLSIRLSRQSEAAESRLMSAARVLAGPGGECIELL